MNAPPILVVMAGTVCLQIVGAPDLRNRQLRAFSSVDRQQTNARVTLIMSINQIVESGSTQTAVDAPTSVPAPCPQGRRSIGAASEHLTVCEVDESVLNRESAVYWTWRQIIENSDGTTPVDHPDYVLTDIGAGLQNFRTQLLVCDPDTPEKTVAVLAPRVIPTRKFSRFLGGMELKVMRLVGSRFYGAGADTNAERLVKMVVTQASRLGADALYLEDIDTDSPLLALFAREFPIWEPQGCQPHHQIRFPEQPDDYWAKFKSKTLKRARNRIRKLGDCELRTFSTVEEVPTFLADANHVSLHSWKRSELGIRISNSTREEQMLVAMAMHGFLRSFILYRDGEPVAFELGYQKGDQYVSDDCAYDGRIADLSPGQVMQHLVVQELCRLNTPAVYDFGFGDSTFKRGFGNYSYQSANVVAVCPKLRSRFKVAALKRAVQAEQLTRKSLGRTGHLSRLRQALRKVD